MTMLKSSLRRRRFRFLSANASQIRDAEKRAVARKAAEALTLSGNFRFKRTRLYELRRNRICFQRLSREKLCVREVQYLWRKHRLTATKRYRSCEIRSERKRNQNQKEEKQVMDYMSFCYCIETSEFFWGNLSARSATLLLRDYPPGAFLVRVSENSSFKYTLSQKMEKRVIHIRIKKDTDGRYMLDSNADRYPTPETHFSCVLNMINCWCRVFRESNHGFQLYPLNITGQNPVYANDDARNICFHDDDAADRCFFDHFIRLIDS